MGGVAKGLLDAPGGGSLVARSCALLRAAGVDEIVLVGAHEAYAHLGLTVLADDPPGIGPLGGLVALLRRAAGGRALALACDMPFVSLELLRRVLDAAPGAPALAPRLDGRWEPFCARYEAAVVLPVALRLVAAGERSLQRVLDQSGARSLELREGEAAQLGDWDTPGDVGRTG
jgi:molybdopterin-guanine dinucleotide biosynthesis protein A